MSDKFIQFRVDEETVEEEELGKNIVLGIPKKDDQDPSKLLLECCSNLYKDCSSHFKPRSTPLDENFSFFVSTMGQLLQYTVNSSSWTDNKLHDYDKFEFKHRLDILKSILK